MEVEFYSSFLIAATLNTANLIRKVFTLNLVENGFHVKQWFSNFSGLRPTIKNAYYEICFLIPFIAENPILHNQNCVDVLLSKLTLNEESSDKSINSPSAFVDMPVQTTSACCEKLDRNSDSQVISN
ncbi:hypothetical protein T01_11172 [Trichinella spiralis]|uniref:Uncharacterized protein n=1 Tax=Trichinella spiralis TaxID=6334 RepID=A0A0V1BT80_TRISP|nr:hypothetical protein T01_11172 [Trichinella spiralis]